MVMPCFLVLAQQHAWINSLQNLGSNPLALPHSRPMPSIGPRCHELRINDEKATWRIIYRIDHDAIVILEVFEKRARQTPQPVIDACKQRLRDYDS